MGTITISEDIAAPVEAVFAYVDDHRNTTKYMKGLTKWAPVGSQNHGKGAKFEVAMKAGPMTLSSVVDITTWTENRAIGWTSLEGFKQTGKWSFKEVGNGSQATFDMDYELPGGLAGKLVSRAAEPIVRSNIDQSVKALKRQVESGATKGAARTTPAAKAAPRAKPAARAKAAPKKR
jgi:uncharacterized membrane protein